MVKDVTPLSSNPLNDEQQSMQALRQYGGYIVLAIVLALAGYFGWTYYQNHGGRVDVAATNDFAKIQASQQAIAALNEQPTDTNKQQLAEKTTALQQEITGFVTAHPDSTYAWQALMMQAKIQSDNNQLKEAVDTLKQATQLKLKDTGLQAIATLRYAQALLANKQLDEANTALAATLPPSFDASKNELLGDIALAKNDKAKAGEFYQKAWVAVEQRNSHQNNQEDRALLRLKMEDLGLSPKIPEEAVSVVAKPKPTSVTSAPIATVPNVAATANSNPHAESSTPNTKPSTKPATTPDKKAAGKSE